LPLNEAILDQAGLELPSDATMLLTTEKIRALVDNIRGNKNRIIEGEVVKKGEDDG